MLLLLLFRPSSRQSAVSIRGPASKPLPLARGKAIISTARTTIIYLEDAEVGVEELGELLEGRGLGGGDVADVDDFVGGRIDFVERNAVRSVGAVDDDLPGEAAGCVASRDFEGHELDARDVEGLHECLDLAFAFEGFGVIEVFVQNVVGEEPERHVGARALRRRFEPEISHDVRGRGRRSLFVRWHCLFFLQILRGSLQEFLRESTGLEDGFTGFLHVNELARSVEAHERRAAQSYLSFFLATPRKSSSRLVAGRTLDDEIPFRSELGGHGGAAPRLPAGQVVEHDVLGEQCAQVRRVQRRSHHSARVLFVGGSGPSESSLLGCAADGGPRQQALRRRDQQQQARQDESSARHRVVF
mmetsp:Transcript_6551/g.20449  ORF Transcript_6551/g.20449 Transcript_6551/m.20449 type:complete len:358 (-) Transcript_6551:7-1080(-)